MEGFWWQDGVDGGVDYGNKAGFSWISVLRLPDFVTRADFDWAVEMAAKKKKMNCSCVEFLTVEEGLCIQMLHVGSYDEEPAAVAAMDAFLEANGYVNDFSEGRLHHEIYLSDPRKTAPEKRKTVIRHQESLKGIKALHATHIFPTHAPIATQDILTHFRRCGRGILKGSAP